MSGRTINGRGRGGGGRSRGGGGGRGGGRGRSNNRQNNYSNNSRGANAASKVLDQAKMEAEERKCCWVCCPKEGVTAIAVEGKEGKKGGVVVDAAEKEIAESGPVNESCLVDSASSASDGIQVSSEPTKASISESPPKSIESLIDPASSSIVEITSSSSSSASSTKTIEALVDPSSLSSSTPSTKKSKTPTNKNTPTPPPRMLAKYKCPTCLIPYCSLQCYKIHKTTNCAPPAPSTQTPINANIKTTRYGKYDVTKDYYTLEGYTQDGIEEFKNEYNERAEKREHVTLGSKDLNLHESETTRGFLLTADQLSLLHNSSYVNGEIKDMGLRHRIDYILNTTSESARDSRLKSMRGESDGVFEEFIKRVLVDVGVLEVGKDGEIVLKEVGGGGNNKNDERERKKRRIGDLEVEKSEDAEGDDDDENDDDSNDEDDYADENDDAEDDEEEEEDR